MDDAPPQYSAESEPALTVPLPADHRSVSTSHSTPRRWDDPPEEEPNAPAENLTTMVFVKSFEIRSLSDSEIMHLAFSNNDSHIAAMLPKNANSRAADPDGACTLHVYSAITGTRLNTQALSGYGVRVTKAGFAFRPGAADLTVACPFNQPSSYADSSPRLEIYSLGGCKRLVKQDLAYRAPVAWSRDGGSLLAMVSAKDPRRFVVLRVHKDAVKLERVLDRHADEVTQLAWLPRRPRTAGGNAVVSVGRDGFVRVTSAESGRTLKKMDVGSVATARAVAAGCGILQVSTNGKMVVSVWGREVVLWWWRDEAAPGGRVHSYSLDVVRQTEGWPLCVSLDCQYLVCRTEDGFDVSDVQTGHFRGEGVCKAINRTPGAGAEPLITAAAFSENGKRLVIGEYTGGLHMYDIVTVEGGLT